MVKNQSAKQETWVRFLGWKDPLKKERLPTPVMENSVDCVESQRVRHNFHFHGER